MILMFYIYYLKKLFLKIVSYFQILTYNYFLKNILKYFLLQQSLFNMEFPFIN